MKKFWLIPTLCLLLAFVLAGCASNADTMMSPSPSVSPSMQATMTPDVSPASTDMPDMTDDANMMTSTNSTVNGIATLEEAKKASEDMEDAIEKLSEVDEAYVVAIGNMALVGVEFDSQYQGAMDERMQKMIFTRIQSISKGITSIAVATDAENLKLVKDLSEALEDATSLDAIKTQADDLSKKLTTYKE